MCDTSTLCPKGIHGEKYTRPTHAYDASNEMVVDVSSVWRETTSDTRPLLSHLNHNLKHPTLYHHTHPSHRSRLHRDDRVTHPRPVASVLGAHVAGADIFPLHAHALNIIYTTSYMYSIWSCPCHITHTHHTPIHMLTRWGGRIISSPRTRTHILHHTCTQFRARCWLWAGVRASAEKTFGPKGSDVVGCVCVRMCACVYIRVCAGCLYVGRRDLSKRERVRGRRPLSRHGGRAATFKISTIDICNDWRYDLIRL